MLATRRMCWPMTLLRPILCLSLAGCSDRFTETYSTQKEPGQDQVFERGWLPDILPASAHSLRVSGDVDINNGDGEFLVSAADLAPFAAKLTPLRDGLPGGRFGTNL